nr:hypothetical protein SPACI_41010 [Sporomusa acidovorans DSM 3132]
MNADLAPGNTKGVQTAAAAKDGHTGGQDASVSINEAKAIADDAAPVGDDDIGPLAGDFEITAQVTDVIAGDFVKDEAGGAAGQVRVALDVAGELGCG